MKKYANYLVFGAVLTVGLPGQAMATDVASVICKNFQFAPGAGSQNVEGSQASAGVTLPSSCAPATTSSCSQCLADLLSNGFKFVNPADMFAQSDPYFFLKRGGKED
ncbi:MAG: hypothetical protein ACREDT_01855 [Methylocella sp.]